MTGEFATVLMTEDSAHYLVFSLVFLYSKPIAMVVLPISLFATVSMLVFLIQVFRRANYTGMNCFNHFRKYSITIAARY